MADERDKSKLQGIATAVYQPPQASLPFLAVIIHPTGKIKVFPAASLDEAKKCISEFLRGYDCDEPFEIY